MKNLKLIALSIFLFSTAFINPSSAQYLIPKKDLSEQLKSKIVIVELSDGTSAEAMKTNETLRNAFKEFWTLTPVEFLSGTEFNKIVSSGDTKYAAFLAYDGEHTLTMQRLDGFNGPVIHEKSFNFSHFDLALSLITGPNKDTPVATISFANKNIMSGDILFAVQQISRLVNASLNDIKGMDYYDHKKNIEFVKTKTLLIPQELFKEKDIEKLKDKYDFTYKVVSLNEMNDLILSKDEQYIYPKIIWSIQHKAYGWLTIYAKDGSVTSFMAFGGIHTASQQSANEVIKVGDLKYIVSNMAQGINNKYK
ncbi:MAG: hypothetical protein IPL22_18675 [Bacteroidetes bacterium]|nr:hypothetical protein [Bacteroidota bacterium]